MAERLLNAWHCPAPVPVMWASGGGAQLGRAGQPSRHRLGDGEMDLLYNGYN
jgi:hypothetical protein